MSEFSVLIGGKAGFGIDRASLILGRILNSLCYRVYIYRDYPSLIRGGHTFSIIRASAQKISAYKNQIDFLLALNQETFDLHKDRLNDKSVVIYDSDVVKLDDPRAIGIPLTKIVKEENASEIMRNTGIIGAFCKAAGISDEILEANLRKEISKEVEVNLKIAFRGFRESQELSNIAALSQSSLPLISGSQAMGMGLIKAGLKNYVAYPMTPASPLLHFLAEGAQDFGLKVIHPESEIAVILMALGFAYAGEKTAVGTSGGGFCLMTEGLSLSAMSELPVVIMMGQRPGPSTGLPTYSSQTELNFVLSAGQGEFSRFVVAPGDLEEAYFWSGEALNLAWKYQIPAFVLTDKNLNEGVFNFVPDCLETLKEEGPRLWDGNGPYQRYRDTEDGVSPLAFVPKKEAVIKVNSYEHDESGITTEDPVLTKKMQDKRLRKEKFLSEELKKYESVKIHGKADSPVALLCWGSNKGVTVEVAENLGLKVVQPLVLAPFPCEGLRKALEGAKKIIAIESNATGQLANLIKIYGMKADELILKYDGRPFTVDELQELVEKIIK